ncbi:hypothetical protein [Methanobrevibacter millerae]|jgi:hypothetical protein|uniref:Uncharacterized protein n=1 Tax=Methanobrevibacter millerae TaxID=230361 RepID=A0A0U2L3Y1_9EURY|nr:hypothetical protein [Methanobrevibacter millerae]ALT68334.1 hypothetical protein sm9_0535 [Methanobrevibacter millerae]MBO6110073.1 hypothetical protein [Methanobrevibacter sp.]MBO6275535.1 hypothetical protein [Methanobrevibacter sp.]MBP3225478.1 hypothetical protein [Methanobrevibacter sp.]
MAVSPVLVIKIVDDSSVGVRARWRDDYSEHHIVLNSVLTYWWANDMPPAVKFLELFESVIKRTINELTPHKNLNIKYEVQADNSLEKASEIEINLIEVQADDIGFKIDGKTLSLKGLRNSIDDDEKTPFTESYDKVIETPDIVLKKYLEMQNK